MTKVRTAREAECGSRVHKGDAFIICCYITNYPHNGQLKTAHIYHFIVSKCQKFRSSLGAWFWFRVCHEIPVNLLARAASSEGLTGAVFNNAYWLAIGWKSQFLIMQVSLQGYWGFLKKWQLTIPE